MKSLLLHKLRSGLTMLGIVFGVFSVIAMLAIGEGASAQAEKQVLELGATNVIAVSIKPPVESSSGGASRQSRVLAYGLKRTDIELVENLDTVTSIVPIRELPEEARHGRNRLNVRIVGSTAGYLPLNRLKLRSGTFVTEQHNERYENVCVLAENVALELFGFEDPIGKSITLGIHAFEVVGVVETRVASAAVGGSLSGQDFRNDVYVPIETFWLRIGDTVVQRATGSFSVEEVEVSQITLSVVDEKSVVPTAEAVRETLQETHRRQRDYDVVVPLELLEQAKQIRTIFNVVLGSIAAISLVVGGIGIMNIMLATVTERTREIGIRRALGAKQSDVTSQFLTETIVLSGTGGVIGILLGLATPLAFGLVQWFVRTQFLEGAAVGGEMASMFTEMTPRIAWWSLPLAFGFSVAIGVVFGIYPARAAARLDPIEALRHE